MDVRARAALAPGWLTPGRVGGEKGGARSLSPSRRAGGWRRQRLWRNMASGCRDSLRPASSRARRRGLSSCTGGPKRREALSPSRALRMLPSVAGAGDRRRGPRNPATGADTARRRRARPGTPRASLTDADKRRLVEAAERRGLSQAALAAYLGGAGGR